MTDPAGYVNIFLMASMWLAEDLFVQTARKGWQHVILLHLSVQLGVEMGKRED